MNTEESATPKIFTKNGYEQESQSEESEKMTQNELTLHKSDDTKTIQMVQKNKMLDDKNESQIDSFEPLQNFMHRELLQANSLINESATLLHGQTKRLLEQESDVRNPSEWNIGVARQNMETIAKLIQTKVNFIKAVRK